MNHSAWENEEVKEMVGRKEKEEEGGERQGDKSMSVKGERGRVIKVCGRSGRRGR